MGAFYHASEGRDAVASRNVEAQPGIEKNMKSLKFSYTVHSAVFSAVTPISRSKDDTRSEDARGEAVTHADILAALAAAIKRPEWHAQGCEAELLESTLREEYRIELNDLDNKPRGRYFSEKQNGSRPRTINLQRGPLMLRNESHRQQRRKPRLYHCLMIQSSDTASRRSRRIRS